MNKTEAFTEMYQRYSDLVVKSVVAQTKDVDLANEICQNVFMSYYQNMDRIEVKFIKTWLLEVTKNQLIDYWRKASTRKEILIEEDSGTIPEKISHFSVEKQYYDKMLICEILEDLKETNEKWYEVIECVCIRQMEHEEAAKYLNIGPVVLRSRLYRARNHIIRKYGVDW